jgi:hypothetical protein
MIHQCFLHSKIHIGTFFGFFAYIKNLIDYVEQSRAYTNMHQKTRSFYRHDLYLFAKDTT